MVDEKTGFGGGGGPQAPKTPSPVVEQKPVKRLAPLGAGIITPEMEKYQAMLAKNPNSRVFAALAECYRKQGMLDEAIHLCIDGVKKYPNYMSGRVALGRAYFDKGMIKEAKEELDKVVSITPNNIVANKVLGDIHLFEEDIDGALGFFSRVLSMSPEDESIAAKIKDIEAGVNPLAEMIEDVTKAEGEGEGVKGPEDAGVEADEEALDISEPSMGAEGIEDVEVLEDIEEIEPGLKEEGLDIDEVGGLELEEGEGMEVDEGDGLEIDEDVGLELDEDDGLELEEGGESLEIEGEGDDIISDIEPIELTEEEEIPIGEEELEVGKEDDLDISEDDIEVAGEGEGYGEDVKEEGEEDVEDEFGILDEVFASGEGVDDLSKAVEEFSKMEVEIPEEIEVESAASEGMEDREAESEVEDEPPVEDSVSKDYEWEEEGDEEAIDEGEYESDFRGEKDISTETIADIYVKQGYLDKALPIYEELSAAFPTRRTLKEKLRKLKNKMGGLDGVAEAGEGEIESFDGIDAEEGPDVVSKNMLNKNIQSLQKWLNNVRKYRRIS